jgi:hypothetical protein
MASLRAAHLGNKKSRDYTTLTGTADGPSKTQVRKSTPTSQSQYDYS